MPLGERTEAEWERLLMMGGVFDWVSAMANGETESQTQTQWVQLAGEVLNNKIFYVQYILMAVIQ
jgi:hypothetical protein